MQRLEVSCAVRRLYRSLGVKVYIFGRLLLKHRSRYSDSLDNRDVAFQFSPGTSGFYSP